MHPALRIGPLCLQKKPIFHFFLQKNTPSFSSFFYKKTPTCFISCLWACKVSIEYTDLQYFSSFDMMCICIK